MSAGWVYRATIRHQRHEPCAHAFTYPGLMLALDVDALPQANTGLRMLGHNRFRPAAVWDRDYLGGTAESGGSLRERIDRWLPGVAQSDEKLLLLTVPRVLHYVFNPISLFYCVGADGTVRRALAEVRNTYGEVHLYPLREVGADGRASARKELFVSPFFGVDGEYEFSLPAPGPRLALGIRLVHDGRTRLSATVAGEGEPLTDAALLAALARHPLTAALALPRISWQAFQLRYRRGLQPRMRPIMRSDRTVVKTGRSAAR